MRLLLICLFALSGCTASSTAWVNPGGAVGLAETAEISCKARAQKAFPPDRRASALRLGLSVGTSVCKGAMCLGMGAPLAGSALTSDRNEGARLGYFEGCMAQAGFRQTRLPRCASGQMVQRLALNPSPETPGLCLRDGRIHRIISEG